MKYVTITTNIQFFTPCFVVQNISKVYRQNNETTDGGSLSVPARRYNEIDFGANYVRK